MRCKICESESRFLFEGTLIKKYSVKYFQCTICEFIQTEEPYWLNESYSGAIDFLDVGLVRRNIELSSVTQSIIRKLNLSGEFLDFGGGSGLFVRLMRDNGFNFKLHDPQSHNIYAKHLDYEDYPADRKFQLTTSFEVFEHLVYPVREIQRIVANSDVVFFSTELVPKIQIKSIDDWWYFLPQSGQHVAFYSLTTLCRLSENLQCHFYSNNHNLHIFSKNAIKNPFSRSLRERVVNRIFRRFNKKNNTSLTDKDFESYKSLLNV